MILAGKSKLKNIISGRIARPEHRIDLLNVKSIGKEHLKNFITERFIENTFSFWNSVKKIQKEPPKVFYEKGDF